MAISARIEELERKFNENPRRYFAPLANEYRKAGDLTQAISICRSYVPQQPAHMSGHIVFGQALFEAGEFEEARGVFESALQLDPENLIALRHLGDIARERGQITAARTWYRRVLDADPRNAEVASLLGSLAGLTDTQPPAEPAVSEALAGWHDINPERTLELPPALAVAPPPAPPEPEPMLPPPAPEPEPAASEPTLEAAPEPEPELERTSGEIEGFFSAEHDAEIVRASTPGEPAPDLGLEVMEFQAPKREERAGPEPATSGPAAFVTETMAELYLQQGFRDEALGVYRQLLEQNPYDDNLRERVLQLESGSRSSVSVAAVSDSIIDAAHIRRNAPSVRSVRAFFGGLAARRVATAAPESEAFAVAADPEPEPEPEPAPDPMPTAVAPPDAESGSYYSVDAYSDDAFSEDSFGANAFTGSLRPRSSKSILQTEEYGGESLVSRVEEEVDAFGMPIRREPADDAATDEARSAAPEARVAEPDVAERDVAERDVAERDVAEPDFAQPGPVAEPEPEAVAEPVLHASVSETVVEPEPEAGNDVHAYAAPAEPAAPVVEAEAEAGSVDQLFGDTPVAATDDAAASTLASAFGGPSTPEATRSSSEPDRTTRHAANELSLDTVFRETQPSDSRRESSAFSFDQFFGSDSAGENVSPVEGAPEADGVAGLETEQFSSWLSGLKKK